MRHAVSAGSPCFPSPCAVLGTGPAERNEPRASVTALEGPPAQVRAMPSFSVISAGPTQRSCHSVSPRKRDWCRRRPLSRGQKRKDVFRERKGGNSIPSRGNSLCKGLEVGGARPSGEQRVVPCGFTAAVLVMRGTAGDGWKAGQGLGVPSQEAGTGGGRPEPRELGHRMSGGVPAARARGRQVAGETMTAN